MEVKKGKKNRRFVLLFFGTLRFTLAFWMHFKWNFFLHLGISDVCGWSFRLVDLYLAGFYTLWWSFAGKQYVFSITWLQTEKKKHPYTFPPFCSNFLQFTIRPICSVKFTFEVSIDVNWVAKSVSPISIMFKKFNPNTHCRFLTTDKYASDCNWLHHSSDAVRRAPTLQKY